MTDKTGSKNPSATPGSEDTQPIVPEQTDGFQEDVFSNILETVNEDISEANKSKEKGGEKSFTDTANAVAGVVEGTSIKGIDDMAAYIAQKKKEKQPGLQIPGEILATDGTDLLKMPGVYAVVPHLKGDHKVVYLAGTEPEGLLPDPAGREKGRPYIKGSNQIYDVYVAMREHATLRSSNGDPLDIWIVDSEEDLKNQLDAIHRGKGGGTNLKDPIIVQNPAAELVITEPSATEEPIIEQTLPKEEKETEDTENNEQLPVWNVGEEAAAVGSEDISVIEPERISAPEDENLASYRNPEGEPKEIVDSQPEVPSSELITENIPFVSGNEVSQNEEIETPIEAESQELKETPIIVESGSEQISAEPIPAEPIPEPTPEPIQKPAPETTQEQTSEPVVQAEIDLDLLSGPTESVNDDAVSSESLVPEKISEDVSSTSKELENAPEQIITKPVEMAGVVSTTVPGVQNDVSKDASGKTVPVASATRSHRTSMMIRIGLLVLLLAAVGLIFATMFSFKDDVPNTDIGTTTQTGTQQLDNNEVIDQLPATGDGGSAVNTGNNIQSGDTMMTGGTAADKYTRDELQLKLERQQDEARDISYQASIIANENASMYAKASYLKAANTLEKIKQDTSILTQEDIVETITKIDYYLTTARDALQQ